MTQFLFLTFLFLAAGILAAPLAARAGFGSVLGYLIAGIALAPILRLNGVDIVEIQHIGEFGVVMLLFIVGLELEGKRLWRMRYRLLGLGGLQVGLTAMLVTLIALALGFEWRTGVAIGLILALSSTAIVLQTLRERGDLANAGGRASFSVLLFQDIAVIPILALLPLLAIPELMIVRAVDIESTLSGEVAVDHGNALTHWFDNLSQSAAAMVTVAAIAFVFFAGRYLSRPLLGYIASTRSREFLTATALLIVVGIALLMSLVGLSPALGAFLAGVVLAGSPYKHELESQIDPFKSLLLGLFFITVGAGINFGVFQDNLVTVLGLSFALIAIKLMVLLGVGFLFRLRGRNLWLFALSVSQAGEFGFVLAAQSLSSGVLGTGTTQLVTLIITVSLFATPLLFLLYDRVIAPKLSKTVNADADTIDENNKIIIAGAGRVGGLLARLLSATGFEATLIDHDAQHLEGTRKFGVRAYFGDATRPELLKSAGIDEAEILIIAIDDRPATTKLVHYMVENHPNVHIIARARNREHVYELYAAGCRDIIRETYDSTLRMGRSAFEQLGIDTDDAREIIATFHQSDRNLMFEAAEHWHEGVPLSENKAYIERVITQREANNREIRQKMDEIRLRTPE